MLQKLAGHMENKNLLNLDTWSSLKESDESHPI